MTTLHAARSARALRASRLVVSLVVAFVTSACSSVVGQTFEPGVEHLESASLVIRIEPPDAIDDRRIVLTSYEDEPTVVFPALRGDGRFLTATTLPSTLNAWVDDARCVGSIELLSGTEADGTLTIDGQVCSLRLELRHREGAIDHGLEDFVPASPQ